MGYSLESLDTIPVRRAVPRRTACRHYGTDGLTVSDARVETELNALLGRSASFLDERFLCYSITTKLEEDVSSARKDGRDVKLLLFGAWLGSCRRIHGPKMCHQFRP